MHKKSFLKNYLKIYSWQSFSIVLNLISMVVVIPLLTSEPEIYGVYSICISFAIYLNYADIGFVSACHKYAGEEYVKNQYKNEIKYYGFSSFIMMLFISIIAIVFILLSYDPAFFIKDINQSNSEIASKLLIIQAIFSFTTVFQRFILGVLSVRIEQYLYDRINIIGSVIKISSVFYFFTSQKYDIVGYFLTTKVIELLVVVVLIVLIKKKFNVSFINFIKSFYFNKEVYYKSKNLAFGSLFSTIVWILYFEIDLIVIGKFLGAVEASYFAVALIAVKFFRTLSSVIFAPFLHRYNHFYGLKDYDGLRLFLIQVFKITTPLILFSSFIVILFSDKIIYNWLGDEYKQSALLLTFLMINYLFSAIIIPSSNILLINEKVKNIYIVNTLVILVYWPCVFITVNDLGVLSFAIFKCLAGLISMLYYLNYIVKYLKIGYGKFFKEIYINLTFSLIFITFSYIFYTNFILNIDTSLIFILIYLFLTFIISLSLLYFFSKFHRKKTNLLLRKIIHYER